ncbi:aspartate aminotransferase [Serpentinicella alkaliphila]|uniref:Aminotransferase n=2 Tax=Serpentinicella alkaliphila TaxID=1734049 RepID=A0A4R2U1J5_9FIRM|nr:aspartate aminotransferase [Serpentinicella alkaliphila]
MQESPIRKLAPYAVAAKKSGKKIYHLNIGQPDILTPPAFMETVTNYSEKVLAYSPSEGIPELIQSIIQYYKGYEIDFEEDEILITNGGSEALQFSIIAIADAGDEILVPEPFYANYNSFCSAVDVNIVPVTCRAEEGFHLPLKSYIEGFITPKTKAIMVSHPGNPTGVVYTKEEVKLLCEIAIEHNLFIISDEVYREFVYDGLEFFSFANVKETEDRVVIIDSISKRFSACGARIGCIASKNKQLIAQILKLCQSRLCAPTLMQIGAIQLYNTQENYFKSVNKEYEKRRDIIYQSLNNIPNVICRKPTGAFYVIAKLPIEDAEDFSIFLLKDFSINNETVMLAPAKGFYSTPGLGNDEVRIAYILKEEDLISAMEILNKGLIQYLNNKNMLPK